jgi:hypothetical protein
LASERRIKIIKRRELIMDERRLNFEHRSDIEIIKESILRIEFKTDTLSEKTDKLEKKIYGNGVAGVLSRVDIIETEMREIQELKENMKESNKENKDLFWKIATLGLSIISIFSMFNNI